MIEYSEEQKRISTFTHCDTLTWLIFCHKVLTCTLISKRLGHSNMMVTGKIYAYLIDEYQAKMDDKIEVKLDKIKG